MMPRKLDFEIQVTNRAADHYSLQIEDDQIVVSRDSSDIEDVRVIKSGEFGALLASLGREYAESVASALKSVIDAGELRELVRAIQSVGTIEYSRIDAEWDF